MYNIFIITIDRGYERYKQNYIYNIKNNIDFIKFNGIDGNKLSSKQIKNITTPLCNFLCTNSMIGCAASHILLWKNISESKLDYAIILEDDTNLYYKMFLDIKLLLEPYLINQKTIIQLSGEGFIKQKINKINSFFSLNKYKYHFFLGSYIISKNAALELSSYYKLNKIDYHIDFSLNNILNKLNINIFILDPKISKQNGLLTSTMFNHDKKILNKINNKIYYSLTFPICKIYFILINLSFMFFLVFLFFLIGFKRKSYLLWFILGFLYNEFITYI